MSKGFMIEKEFKFEAAHQLNGLPPEHKCSRLHGHSYRVRVQYMNSYLDDNGFVVDYANLDFFNEWLQTHFDHRNLNEVMIGSGPTSAENVARYLFDNVLSQGHLTGYRYRIGVSETQKTWAWYGHCFEF